MSYKVTSFLDFQPFINGFQCVNNYLDNLGTDFQDPYYFRYSLVPIAHINIDPTINNSHVENFLNSRACAQHPYSCQAKMQFEKFKWEIHYKIKIFHATYKKFLTARDHIDYHPSQIQNNITRTKRSITHDIHGCYYSPTKILTPSEEHFLNAFMEALYKINPSLHKNLSRMKTVGIFTWILGWGIFLNAINIAKIKDNIHIFNRPLILLYNSIMYGFSNTELIFYLLVDKLSQPNMAAFFWSVWENIFLAILEFLKSFIIFQNCDIMIYYP